MLQAMWTDRDDGWKVATIQGHDLRVRQTGPNEFQLSIDGQARTRREPEATMAGLQLSMARTALMLPPR